jgi:hypothetical protein
MQEAQVFLELALEQMPKIFSSNEFSQKSQALGYPKELIPKGFIARFLHRNCNQLDSTRMWAKEYSQANQPTSKSISNDVENAITLLKKNGYKISKQVIDWKEI